MRNYTLTGSPASSGSNIDYAAELNPQQFAAVTSPPGPALVIAGAGSGKTRTLTYRVAYLLDNGIEPYNILLLTFTNKAAREMMHRVENLLGIDTRQLWGGTFHSVGNRILRRHADRIGFERNFSILDREDQKELLATVVAECEIDGKAGFPKPEVLGDLFSMATNTETRLQKVLERRNPHFAEMGDAIAQVRKAYEAKKKQTNNLDFDDLLAKTLVLLDAEPDVLERFRHQFQFVMVDEYQDTNKIQARLIDAFAGKHHNVMVVGDDAQSIYSWRGANFRNILKFPERYPEAKIFKIETNYRSVPEILSLANHAIRANAEQFEKALQPARPDCKTRPALVRLNSPSEQAQFVAQRIEDLIGEGIELEEMAVLYRAHFHSMEVQMELKRRGIPFQITSGLQFFEQAHIKDVASYLRFAANRRDEVAFKRMVRMLPGIGDKSAAKLWQCWSGGPGGGEIELFSEHLLEFKVPAKAKKTWEQLAYTLDELIPGGELAAPQAMIKSVLGGVYEDYLRSKYPNYDSRRQDLEQLMQFAGDFSEVEPFLAELSLLSGVDTDKTPDVERDSREKVTLSTVHQAKGLEWRACFVIWLADGMMPNSRVLEEDTKRKNHEGLEEERRLFYVAVTRAKDELYLTYPVIWRNAYSGDVIQKPSRFLGDFPVEAVEEWNVGHF